MIDLKNNKFINEILPSNQFRIIEYQNYSDIMTYNESNLFVDQENYFRFYDYDGVYNVAEVHRDRIYKYDSNDSEEQALCTLVCLIYGCCQYDMHKELLKDNSMSRMELLFNELLSRITKYYNVETFKDSLHDFYFCSYDIHREVFIER